MNLGRAKAKFDTDPEGARSWSTQAHQEAKDSITELRNVVRGVHPAVLTDRGLDAALSALAARSPVPVRLDVDVRRAAQPAPSRRSPTSSSARPSPTSPSTPAPTQAVVHIERDGDRLLVSRLRRRPRRRRQRARAAAWPGCATGWPAVDGTFRLQSSPTGGTTVTVEVPCAS